MIYKQVSYLPIIFQVDEGIISKVENFLHRNKFFFTNVLVISGTSYSLQFAHELVNQNNWKSYILEGNSFDEVEHLKCYCEENRYDLLIGLGGGKVLDAVKRVSYLTNINHLSVPTIISNDGLISPISVLKNKSGKTESLPGMMPMGVIIDLDIIKNSPLNYVRAAAGDILTNISATNDWILAHEKGKDTINDIGFHLSKSAANALLYFKNVDLTSKAFLRMVVQGQINSGIAMSLAGTSRPCSGSEHLLSHAIDYLELASEKILHGIQVASISLFSLFLQKKLMKIHLSYALATDIPLSFVSFLKDHDEETLTLLFEKAKEMRPGRFTVLDTLDKDKFIRKVHQFKGFVEEYTEKDKL